MFLKLLKFDFKQHSKSFLAVVISILLSTIMVITESIFWKKEIREYDTFLLFMSMIFSLTAAILTLIAIINCFKNKFIREESSLTYTLPISRSTSLLSSIISSFIWIIIIAIEGFLCFLWLLTCYNSGLKALCDGVNYFGSLNISLMLANCIFQAIAAILLIYLCININQTINLRQLKALPGLILFFVMCYIEIDVLFKIGNHYFSKVDYNKMHISKELTLALSGMLAIILFLGIFFYLSNLYLINKKIEG